MTDFFQNITVTSFPDITKIEFKSINNKYLKVILIHVFLVFLIVFVAVFIANYNGLFEILENSVWLYLGILLIFIFTLTIKIKGFKKRKYAVREKDVSYKKGLFFRSLTTVPFNRIQHVEIDEAPVSRFFNLVSLFWFFYY